MLNVSYYPNSQNPEIEKLSAKERKAYRERLRYWSSKGLPLKEAQERASQVNKPKYQGPEPSPEPTAEEIASLVKELQAPAQKAPTHILNQTGQVIPIMRPSPAETPNLHLADFLPLAGTAIIVAGISALLISASLEVFGQTWQGWLKALLLEVGILYLSLCRCPTVLILALKRTTAAALIFLSLFVLKTGAMTDSLSRQKQAEASDSESKILKNRYERLSADYNSLPGNYTTRRKEVQQDLAKAEQALSAKFADFKNSASSAAIAQTGIAEILLRICLVAMNLFFTHDFIYRIKKLNLKARGSPAA
jgi:hypothetical protein